ncbi:MAG: ABC transporter transmembrane domain-containing protein, partial [Hyphomonadaceae bacterium]
MSQAARAGGLIQRLWRDHVRAYAGDLALLIPALVLVAAAGTAYAFIMKWTIDGVSAGDRAIAIWGPLAILGATLVRAFAIWAQTILAQGLGLKTLRDIQAAMFAKLTRADLSRFGREDVGQLVSRFTNDINVVSE